MFSIGDRVVYPMHGAGVIAGVEEKQILGTTKKYYIMNLRLGDMKVMIPTDSANKIGLRQIIHRDELPKVFSILRGEKSVMSKNWNRRYRKHVEQLKSGDVCEVAEVVRNLSLREREKGLSTGERKMLENAKQILVSELILVEDVPEEKATAIVEDCFEDKRSAD